MNTRSVYLVLIVLSALTILTFVLRGCDGPHTNPLEPVEERKDSILILKEQLSQKDGVIVALRGRNAILQHRYDSLARLTSKPIIIYETYRARYHSAPTVDAWVFLGQRPDSLWRQPAGLPE